MNRPHTLAERLNGVLAPLFSAAPLFVSDSSALVEWLGENGCESAIDEYHGMAARSRSGDLANVVAMFTGRKSLPGNKEWNEVFHASRALLLPLLSFDPSLKASKYTISRMSESSFSTAVQMNKDWLTLLGSKQEIMVFGGNGTDFTCGIDDEANPIAPKIDVDLEPGEWVSIGSYLETAMVSQPDDISPSFDVNGTFSVPGIAMAYHRQLPDSLLPLIEETWSFFHALRVANCFPLQIEVRESRIIRAMAGSKDVTDSLLQYSNPKWELRLTEMAFGTNIGCDSAKIDWSFNSQLNEGPIGVHFAIGEGLTGAHIDFICPDVHLMNP
jgi:hypothetical protein